MTNRKPSKKPATSAPGVKMLITAASLAATLGGWAVISAKDPKPTAALVPTQAAAPAVTIKFAPLPTLVPPITPQPQSQLVTIGQSRPTAPRPAVAVPAPRPAPSTELVLRDVSAPPANSGVSAPAPVANSGSSR